MTYLSAFSYPDGVSLFNGPFVPRTSEGEAFVRETARQDLKVFAGYRAYRIVDGEREVFWVSVADEDIDDIIRGVDVWICPFRGKDDT